MKYRPRRKPTDYPIVLLTELGELSCQVLDVNEHGALVRHDHQDIRPGEVVNMKLRGREYGARVVWAHEDEVGLTFTRPLPKDVHALFVRQRH